MRDRSSWILRLPDYDSSLIDGVRCEQDKKIHGRTAGLFLVCAEILREYEERVTVRQLYYQLVSRGFIENSARAYANLIHHLTNARKSEFIPWNRFVDRARSLLAGDDVPPDFNLDRETPHGAAREQVEHAFNPYAVWNLPRWWDQPTSIEVWTEKDALAGIMEPICEEWGVSLVVGRGYVSYTYRREAEARLSGEQARILYFGDLDPSGVDIPRMLAEDLPDVDIVRVALLPDQAKGLPPNPVKETDTRSKTFLQTYPELEGTCYELDALSPPQLREMVESAIRAEFDPDIGAERDRRIADWRNEYKTELSRLRGAVDWDRLMPG